MRCSAMRWGAVQCSAVQRSVDAQIEESDGAWGAVIRLEAMAVLGGSRQGPARRSKPIKRAQAVGCTKVAAGRTRTRTMR